MSDAMHFAFVRPEPLPPNGRAVAIVGGGPSGLAAAGYLASLGYQVDVYDKLPKAGGLMTFGIPSQRIPPGRIQAGVLELERHYGVNFHLQTKICCSAPLHEEEGDHFSCDIRGMGELVEDHDAVIICTGSWKSRTLNIPGEQLPGVYTSLQFLFPIRAAGYGKPGVTAPAVQGQDVVVIGAGHSAVDVAHSALRLEARSVTMCYRKTRRDAPCGLYEIEQLEAAGVRFLERHTPLRFEGEEGLTGLACRVEGQPDPVTLPAQAAVTAIGEIPSPPFARELGLENVRKGDVKWLNMTAIENVFVAGDVLTGPSKIGKAIESGLKAARSLANWLDLKAQSRQAEFQDEERVPRPAPRTSPH
ncbi:FAD-dependent oxidoreductase [Megalodesulfovibrio paquesii]